MTYQQTFRIFSNGGIISPEDLRKMAQIARSCNCTSIQLGSKQELYLQVEAQHCQGIQEALSETSLSYEYQTQVLQNIVTSFVAIHIIPSTTWLLADTYLDILESFNHKPRLKVNIVDALQNLVPLFTGELNFIASNYPRYWYLYLQLPRFGKRQLWPVLIDGDEIGSLSKQIEAVYLEKSPDNIQELFTIVNEDFNGRSRPIEQELQIPMNDFPVYEGMHKAGSTYWLGIYRQNHSLSIDFIEALCKLCVETKIGKICLTPWKSLLLKDIQPEDKLKWTKLLGLFGINTQHSALELNWQLADMDAENLQLRNRLIQEMKEFDAGTAGLSFAIKSKSMDVATSVVIQKDTDPAEKTTYSISHTIDFTSTQTHWQTFAKHLPVHEIVPALIKLCHAYYTQLGGDLIAIDTEETLVFLQTHQVFQCPDCLTQYDPAYGDQMAGIAAHTSLADLPDAYVCSICETPKSSFILMESEQKILN